MNPSPSPSRRGVYLITPDEADTGRLLSRLQPLLAQTPALLQYRNKAAGPALRRQQALAMAEACARAGVPLVVNDDWRLALDVGALGAHLGEHDGDLRQARREAPGLWLGASCYDELERARQAVAAGADYVAFGAFFPSGTKPGARRADPRLLAESATLGCTRVAIGGITPDNAAGLVAAGADLLAVIGGVFDAPDPVAALQSFRLAFEPNTTETTHP
ncbi:thiamine-phosphate synthase [Arenimonas soli]|uniref:Thiamine-phosphate synthase n=1 Tax=Arenimonas soli TaxID=2269504 RepID=A0ABQ1HR23_9GAMM|nr:thiamine phosphate synthase [Arenimonas soli]GGA86740.1 thiamine-phosphate synthase [Arenimonas soli]